MGFFSRLKKHVQTSGDVCETGICYPNLRIVTAGYLYRSSEPKSFEDLKRIGLGLRIRTLIDLRLDENRTDGFYDPREQDWCEKLGIKHVSIPMHDKAPILESEFDNALEWLRLPDMAPFLVHCVGGRDRTGAVIAAYRVLDLGWTMPDAWAEAERYGYDDGLGHKPVRLSWESYVRDKLKEKLQ